MRRIIVSPLVRISFSLTMLTISILLVTDILGFVPDTRTTELQFRKVITESLAVQASTAIDERQLNSLEQLLRSVVERNDKVLSAALRTDGGEILASFGDHDQHWTLQKGDRSTSTQVQVSVFNGQNRWGSVELRFVPISNGMLSLSGSFLSLMLFMGGAGFLAYLLFLKRAMHELNPDEVIPDRVRQALDTLSEGLLIIDTHGYIVFSNSEFAQKVGLEHKALTGKDIGGLDWQTDAEDCSHTELPWFNVLKGNGAISDIKLRLQTEFEKGYTFSVNASPITAAEGEIRGALVTFNNITETEQKNEELHRALEKLESSRKEISRQNKELRILATHDPLTGVLNRRSLFQGFGALFAEALEDREELSCIMVDIDHFKSVNDQYGHTVGDEVIKRVAKVLTDHSRVHDLVGRYGGEEFCVVLPETDIKIGTAIAERMRLAMKAEAAEQEGLPDDLKITASFGVSSTSSGVTNLQGLVEKADKALYEAKSNGRNCVVQWHNAVSGGAVSDELSTILNESFHDNEILQISAPEQTGIIAAENLSPEETANAQVQQLSPMNQEEGLGIQFSTDDGLPNNALFLDCIDQGINRARRDRTRVAVLVMDIDTLKRVYDTLGLAVGDKLVKVITSSLKQTLRPIGNEGIGDQDEMSSVIQRLESNKIAVALTDLKQLDTVTSILQRIFSAFEQPVEVEGGEYYLNVKMGVSVFPLDGEDPETLLRNAIIAMREAKQTQGQNLFRFYASDNNQRAKKHIEMEAELHQAIDRGELLVYYQPKVDMGTGSILSMEALIRWDHPRLGIVPPDDFIQLAEHTGLIDRMSRWVFRAVCRQIIAWQEAGYGTITIAVNLSPVEFRNPDLGEQIIALVAESGVSPEAIEIEITETAVIQNMDSTISILETLSHAGFKISIDDFGTGYSSLSYLKRFPLSKVKIDRSFITGVTHRANDAAIVRAIIAMSHSLGLQVVGEGVETEEEMRFLQGILCDEIQGYLISKPVPGTEIKALMEQSSDIRRMVMDRGLGQAGPGVQGQQSVSDMIGILNDCPVNDPVR